MHHIQEDIPPCTLLFRCAHVLMAPTRPLGRLLGTALTPISLISGVLLGTYAYLCVTRRVVLRHGRPLFPTVLPFPLKLRSTRLMCDSAGAPPPLTWELECLVYRNAGATTAEMTTSTLATLVGYRSYGKGIAHWDARYVERFARTCAQPHIRETALMRSLPLFEQQVLLPFIAENPDRAHDLVTECLQIVGWLHVAQGCPTPVLSE